jgi:hypothetical protein
MSKTLAIVLGGFGAVLLLLALLVGGSWYKYSVYGNTSEVKLQAMMTNNQQMLGKHSTQIAEMAQVNDMYKDDLKEVYAAAMQGRYGENGSGAVMQWLKEHNPNFDSALYTKLQQTIEANRNEFTNAQTLLIDAKAVYQTQLGNPWSGLWLSFSGYPKIKLDDIKIITSSHAVKAYEDGVDNGITIRKEKQ